MSASKTFHLGDILSVTTGKLVSPRHIDGVYDILNWMTGDNLFTHQLPRAMDECQGPLLAQHPGLAAVVPPEDFGPDPKAGVEAWLAGQVAIYGETREVAPLADDVHGHVDPLDELHLMRPDAKIIVVAVPDTAVPGADDSRKEE
jgi:hypothetical protein